MKSLSVSRGVRLALLTAVLSLVASGLAWPVAPAGARVHGGGGGRGRWRVLAPVTYKNLTLFPVVSNYGAVAGSDDYVTLDEGVKRGTVVITERGGATARARNRRTAARGDDDATVNQLALVNKTGKKLLLLAGEVIVGGKQDRIVEEDLIIPPVSVPVSLNVFCVEPGRWAHRASAGGAGGAGSGGGPVAAPIQAQSFSTLGAISHPKLRAAAQDKKDQSEVWKEVRENNAKLGTKTGTETYQEVYSNREVESRMEDYVAELQKAGAGANVVGVVVARNGEFVWVDAFASHALFARYWPKLLKSYVVDAMGDQRSERVPTVAQASLYVNSREGGATVTSREGVFRLYKIEGAGHAAFYLEDLALPAPLLLHFNKMQK